MPEMKAIAGLFQVGKADLADGHTVAAIIQLGRVTYSVYHVSTYPRESSEPIVLQQSDIYSITDFQAPALVASAGWKRFRSALIDGYRRLGSDSLAETPINRRRGRPR